MCYSPVRVPNPSRKFRADMPLFLTVPCGHCPDCLRNAHNEWYFRAYMEYLNCKASNGAVYFLTLTYNDDNLPSMTFPDGSKQLCFYKRHIHNFIKYLRIQLKNLGYPYKEIKYLICSEYGKNGTERPHYHPLLFFPKRVPWKVLFDKDNGVIPKAWHYGFVVCSRMGFEVRSCAGIRYATKYVCKNLGFYKEGPIWDFLHGVGVDKDTYKMRKSLINDFLPRVWSSVHFGECFIDKVVNKQKDIPLFLSNNKYNLNNGTNSNYRIPRYYHLKLEKEINKCVSACVDKVVLDNTEVGNEVKRIIYVHKLLTEKCRLNSMSLEYLTNTLPSFCSVLQSVTSLREHGHYDSNCYRFEYLREGLVYDDLPQLISNALKDIDIDKLAKYRCYLRDYPIFDDDVPDAMFNYVDDIIHVMIHGRAIPPEYIGTYFPFLPNGVMVARPLEKGSISVYDLCRDNPYFAQYEYVSKLLDFYEMCVSIVKESSYLEKKYSKEKTKNAFKGSCIILKSI